MHWDPVPGATKYWVRRGDGYAGYHSGKALVATVINGNRQDRWWAVDNVEVTCEGTIPPPQ
jgi:hypothetical protein